MNEAVKCIDQLHATVKGGGVRSMNEGFQEIRKSIAFLGQNRLKMEGWLRDLGIWARLLKGSQFFLKSMENEQQLMVEVFSRRMAAIISLCEGRLRCLDNMGFLFLACAEKPWATGPGGRPNARFRVFAADGREKLGAEIASMEDLLEKSMGGCMDHLAGALQEIPDSDSLPARNLGKLLALGQGKMDDSIRVTFQQKHQEVMGWIDAFANGEPLMEPPEMESLIP